MMVVVCTKTHLCFGEGIEYELIMEHPVHYAIFDAKGMYRLVGKDYFEKRKKKAKAKKR